VLTLTLISLLTLSPFKAVPHNSFKGFSINNPPASECQNKDICFGPERVIETDAAEAREPDRDSIPSPRLGIHNPGMKCTYTQASLLENTLSPSDSPAQFRRAPDVSGKNVEQSSGIRWGATLKESLIFTTTMNLFRVATEPSTRKDLRGPFWSDYIHSVGHLKGWRDGDEFLVNYIGHPLEGTVVGNILIHNDPKGASLQFGSSREYWISRLKAMGWAAVISTQFEIGPFGEATIGNVGLVPSDKSPHPMAYVDLVVTPIIGTAWLIGEDMLDRYVVKKIEAHTTNRFVRLMFRSWLNPGRSFANMMRGEWWWHRDDRPLKEGGRAPVIH